MLPDFPKSRREIARHLRLRMDLRVQAKSPLRALGIRVTQHEGVQHSYEQITDSGIRSVTEGFKEVAIPIQVPIDEIPDLVGDKLLAKVDAIAEDAARQVSEITFRKLDEVTRESGRGIDAGGGPPTKEIWIVAFETMDIDFDEQTGAPELTMLMHPVMADAMQKLWSEWERDSAFMKRYQDLLTKKREEWRDRESRRKLVD